MPRKPKPITAANLRYISESRRRLEGLLETGAIQPEHVGLPVTFLSGELRLLIRLGCFENRSAGTTPVRTGLSLGDAIEDARRKIEGENPAES